MNRNVVIIANLQKDIKAIELYNLFKQDGYQVSFLDYKLIDGEFNIIKSVRSIQNSVVIIACEFSDFGNIDRTNKLIYISNLIEPYAIQMLPRIDKIITTNYESAYNICNEINQLQYKTPVHKILPYIKPLEQHKFKSEIKMLVNGNNYGLSIQRVMSHAIIDITGKCEGIKWWHGNIEKPNINDYDIIIDFQNDQELIMSAIAHGIIVIAINKSPVNELICNGINGYLISSETSLVRVLNELQHLDNRISIGSICYKNILSNYENWCDDLISTIYDIGPSNLNIITTRVDDPELRRWIVPTTLMYDGRVHNIPTHFDRNVYKIVAINDIEHILKYFVSQRFKEVIIFGWEFGDHNDKDRKNRILNLIKTLGKRGMNIFWCLHKSMPKEWSDIFNTMMVIPIQEGIKRVANI